MQEGLAFTPKGVARSGAPLTPAKVWAGRRVVPAWDVLAWFAAHLGREASSTVSPSGRAYAIGFWNASHHEVELIEHRGWDQESHLG